MEQDAPVAPVFLTQAKYAEHRGCSRQHIGKLKKEGRLVLQDVDGKELVDVVQSDAELDKTSDPTKGKNGAPAMSQAGGATDNSGYKDARADRERTEAELKRLKLEEAQGHLISRTAAEAAVFGAMRTVRDRITAAASLIADRVSTLETKEQRITVIREEHAKAMTQAADQLERDGLSIGEALKDETE